MMNLQKAQDISQEIVEKLKPFCSKIEVAGSIRRKKSWVNDIDIICIPINQGQFAYTLQSLGRMKVGGHKLIRVELPIGVSVDVYIATPETWSTLLLIRTGSKENNIALCKRALTLGMKLHADGSGLEKNGNRIAGDSEESIFKALGLPYVVPEKRN